MPVLDEYEGAVGAPKAAADGGKRIALLVTGNCECNMYTFKIKGVLIKAPAETQGDRAEVLACMSNDIN